MSEPVVYSRGIFRVVVPQDEYVRLLIGGDTLDVTADAALMLWTAYSLDVAQVPDETATVEFATVECSPGVEFFKTGQPLSQLDALSTLATTVRAAMIEHVSPTA